ncbi:VOC family protein [Brachybacterium sp.]|uniref:VOC family protein n=1 Tax=Brachybacterium sp. TaxID=1891286 RepID=UPI002ED2F653
MTATTHHAISYIELGVTDLAAARTFYESAFGWEFNDYGPAYSGIRAADGEGEIGGLNPGAEPSTAGPLVLLFSEDLDATVEAVKGAGGTVVAGPYEFPGGRRFEFTDTSGNRLGVFADS